MDIINIGNGVFFWQGQEATGQMDVPTGERGCPNRWKRKPQQVKEDVPTPGEEVPKMSQQKIEDVPIGERGCSEDVPAGNRRCPDRWKSKAHQVKKKSGGCPNRKCRMSQLVKGCSEDVPTGNRGCPNMWKKMSQQVKEDVPPVASKPAHEHKRQHLCAFISAKNNNKYL